MLHFKAKLMIVTYIHNEKSSLIINLNNSFDYRIDNYEGPHFECGRQCIVSFDSKNKITSLYLLDSSDKPFQVFGKMDILDEGCVVYDYTKEILKAVSYAKQICISAFNSLFKNEIEDNLSHLTKLESNVFCFLLKNNIGWKSSKKKIIEILDHYDFEKLIKDKLTKSIMTAPMPKQAIYKKPFIDLDDYPTSTFVIL